MDLDLARSEICTLRYPLNPLPLLIFSWWDDDRDDEDMYFAGSIYISICFLDLHF